MCCVKGMEMQFFKTLNLKQQVKEIMTRGVCLLIRRSVRGSILLYSLTGFLVEVCYSGIDEKVEEIRPLEYVDHLDPYLDLIRPSA